MSQTYRVLMADDSAFAHTVVAKYLAGTEFHIVGDAKTDVAPSTRSSSGPRRVRRSGVPCGRAVR